MTSQPYRYPVKSSNDTGSPSLASVFAIKIAREYEVMFRLHTALGDTQTVGCAVTLACPFFLFVFFFGVVGVRVVVRVGGVGGVRFA